jgi:hypothetical protein
MYYKVQRESHKLMRYEVKVPRYDTATMPGCVSRIIPWPGRDMGHGKSMFGAIFSMPENITMNF